MNQAKKAFMCDIHQEYTHDSYINIDPDYQRPRLTCMQCYDDEVQSNPALVKNFLNVRQVMISSQQTMQNSLSLLRSQHYRNNFFKDFVEINELCSGVDKDIENYIEEAKKQVIEIFDTFKLQFKPQIDKFKDLQQKLKDTKIVLENVIGYNQYRHDYEKIESQEDLLKFQRSVNHMFSRLKRQSIDDDEFNTQQKKIKDQYREILNCQEPDLLQTLQQIQFTFSKYMEIGLSRFRHCYYDDQIVQDTLLPLSFYKNIQQKLKLELAISKCVYRITDNNQDKSSGQILKCLRKGGPKFLVFNYKNYNLGKNLVLGLYFSKSLNSQTGQWFENQQDSFAFNVTDEKITDQANIKLADLDNDCSQCQKQKIEMPVISFRLDNHQWQIKVSKQVDYQRASGLLMSQVDYQSVSCGFSVFSQGYGAEYQIIQLSIYDVFSKFEPDQTK